MADLRSNFEGTLVTLRNQPFELRWARYWSMVLEALEYAPETLEYLNRLIVDQEEHLAGAQGRPTIEKALGGERAQLRQEADDAVMELLRPFFNSEGTPSERAAIATERRRIRAEIHPHAERADSADAYETYVLVLDYATAFAAASASAFRTAQTPQPRTVQPADAGAAARPGPPHAQTAQRTPQAGYRPPPRPQPEPRVQHRPVRAEPRVEPRSQPLRAAPQAERRPHTDHQPLHDNRSQALGERPPHRHGELQPLEQRDARPIPISMPADAGRPKGRLFGKIITGFVLLALIAGGGAAYVIKPQWFDPAHWTSATVTEDDVDTTPDTTQTAAEPEATEPAGAEVPSTALDRFYAAIIDTKAGTCTPPADITASNWSEISTFTDCARSQGVELVSTFRFMLSQAGGKWSETGNWSAPEGPMQVQLSAAWRHITQTRNRWTAQASASVKEYASSFFGFQSHGITGWRFAAWRCRCNVKGEFIAGDTANVKPRLFITPPAQIQTEDEARQAYTQVRNFFLGATAPGKPPAVEQAANAAALPFDLPGGLGMGRPFLSEEDAKKAWQEVTALHIGIGFEVNELKWGSN